MKEFLLNRKIGVVLTDTIYGIVGLALDKEIVERIYKIKGRDLKKPMVVLISSISDLSNVFGIKPQVSILKEFWPGNVSVILPCEKFPHIHRGLNTIAFRVPNKKELIEILKETGPLIATSANKEGEKPASTIEEAKEYFKEEIDFYIDGGVSKKEPSILVNFKNENEIEILRGKVCLKEY